MYFATERESLAFLCVVFEHISEYHHGAQGESLRKYKTPSKRFVITDYYKM